MKTEENDEYPLMLVNTVLSNKPIVVSVMVDKHPLDMELDTGAAVSEETFNQHWAKLPLLIV